MIKLNKKGDVVMLFPGDRYDKVLEVYPLISDLIYSDGNLLRNMSQTKLSLEAPDKNDLQSLKKRFENGSKSLAKIKPVTKLPAGLSKESAGDVVSRIMFDKIKTRFRTTSAVHFTTFYNDLQKVSGVDLKAYHRERVEGRNTRNYPFRKIDSVIDALGAEYVLDFARNYKFPDNR